MKKVNFKKVVMALLTVFALTFGAQDVEAQFIATDASSTVDLYHPAYGTFVGSDEAKSILEDLLPGIKHDLANYSAGQPYYDNNIKPFLYYVGIYKELNVGKSVSEAIGIGLSALNDSNGFGELPRTELEDLRQGAIDLLQ